MPDGLVRGCAARLLAVTLLCAGCASQQDVIQQQQDKLESLGATTQLIAEDWLAGSVSGTYTRTALDQTFRQVEQQRTALVRSPEMLLDQRAASLSQEAAQLSRLIAEMRQDVAHRDGAALRARLGAIPLVPAAR